MNTPKKSTDWQRPVMWLSGAVAVAIAVSFAVLKYTRVGETSEFLYISRRVLESSLPIIVGIVATVLALSQIRAGLRQEQNISSGVDRALTTLEAEYDDIRSRHSLEYDVIPPGETSRSEDQSGLTRSWSVVRASSRVQPAWDVARGTLEKYWARNLNQNAFIFMVSVMASAFGFAVTIWGCYTALQDPTKLSSAILAAASGVVTQVIGATFLVIYRSTAQQGLEFNRTLERINSVGTAWYVLQTMSEETDAHRKAKDAAKAALVLSVVAAGGNAAVVVAADKDEKSDTSGQAEKK
jgi:hypothetical protein